MDLNTIQFVIVFLVFLAVLIVVAADMRISGPAARRRRRGRGRDADPFPEDIDSDDIADDNSPSRTDDW